MTSYPKQGREQDKSYLKHVKSNPCIVCNSKHTEPHHTVSRGAFGSDYLTVSLCRMHHVEFHTIGMAGFECRYNIRLDKEIIALLIGFIKGGLK